MWKGTKLGTYHLFVYICFIHLFIQNIRSGLKWFTCTGADAKYLKGGVQFRSTGQTREFPGGGASFGPNVKKPTS